MNVFPTIGCEPATCSFSVTAALFASCVTTKIAFSSVGKLYVGISTAAVQLRLLYALLWRSLSGSYYTTALGEANIGRTMNSVFYRPAMNVKFSSFGCP